MDFNSMLKTECECMGKTYTLTSSLDDPNITMTGKNSKGEDKNIVGYATLDTLILCDKGIPLNTILKSGLKPEMLTKDWEHLYGIKLNTEKGSVNQTALILVTRDMLFERFAREWINPLEMTPAQVTNFAKEVNAYAKQISKREEQKELTEAAMAMIKAKPDLTFEQAMSFLKGD